MKILPLPLSLTLCLFSCVALARKPFDGTWKLDVGTIPTPKAPLIWLLKDGVYECKSCSPPIRVKADGQDQPTPHQVYDTISVSIVDDHTVREIEKKNGQIVSNETFTVSNGGKTVTDEFANWKVSMNRIAQCPPGAHALSGSWQPLKLESTSDTWLLITYKLEGETLRMSRPTGEAFRARLDGTEAPYLGNPNITNVSVTRIGSNTIEETDKFNGKPILAVRTTVGGDGKSMTIVSRNLENGATFRFAATKQ